MPKLNFVQSARKDNPVAKKGESYYWWQFRNGGKRFSKNRPPRSALTQSPYLAQAYDLEDAFSDFSWGGDLEALQGEVQELADLSQDSLDNMPDALQDGPTGELLQERIDACEEAVSEIENLICEKPEVEDELEPTEEEQTEIDDWVQQVADFDISVIQI